GLPLRPPERIHQWRYWPSCFCLPSSWPFASFLLSGFPLSGFPLSGFPGLALSVCAGAPFGAAAFFGGTAVPAAAGVFCAAGFIALDRACIGCALPAGVPPRTTRASGPCIGAVTGRAATG